MSLGVLASRLRVKRCLTKGGSETPVAWKHRRQQASVVHAAAVQNLGAVADIPVLNDPARFAPPVAAPTNWPTDASLRVSTLRAFPHLRPTPEMTWAALYARSLHRQWAGLLQTSKSAFGGSRIGPRPQR